MTHKSRESIDAQQKALIDVNKIRLRISNFDIRIFIDHGDEQLPTTIVYWNKNQVKKNDSLFIEVAKDIQLFYTNKLALINKLWKTQK